MHSKDIFLPSFDFVNNKIIDNTKYSEKSTNKYFPNSYFVKMVLYMKTVGDLNKIFSLHCSALALGNQS